MGEENSNNLIFNSDLWTKLTTTPYIPGECCIASISSNPKKENIITLKTAYTVDRFLVDKDPTNMDKFIKEELARQLAQQMINEDLIVIYHDYDIEENVEKFRAEVKIVQE